MLRFNTLGFAMLTFFLVAPMTPVGNAASRNIVRAKKKRPLKKKQGTSKEPGSKNSLKELMALRQNFRTSAKTQTFSTNTKSGEIDDAVRRIVSRKTGRFEVLLLEANNRVYPVDSSQTKILDSIAELMNEGD